MKTETETETVTVVLAGQSNMAGRGGLRAREDGSGEMEWCAAELTGAERELAVAPEGSGVTRLTAERKWVPATEPMHADVDTKKACGVGPGVAFGRELARLRGGRASVRLVPCAVGGTRLEEWGPQSQLYRSLVERARFALGSVGAGTAAATRPVLLWMQGESDALREDDARAYADRLREFLARVRADLGENLLVVGVVIGGSTAKLPYVDEVRAAQRLVFSSASVDSVDAADLELLPDGLHLTTSASIALGVALARVVHSCL